MLTCIFKSKETYAKKRICMYQIIVCFLLLKYLLGTPSGIVCKKKCCSLSGLKVLVKYMSALSKKYIFFCVFLPWSGIFEY